MRIKLYLDDIRELPNNSYILVRSYNEAIQFIKDNGIPSFISFDHDLGEDEFQNILPNGYDFAKWLVEMDMENIYTFPNDFSFYVHSSNIVGKKNIESYLNNYLSLKK
ncbi:cyclic-phosphate processing receiver domain-containing protein [Aliarcobacter butzleri]|uniref:cyclic-phosphate processing receiver domain-containing protein n=1 Tax=Aliarcobacter butzleri TaxID=28197 RepID=UPI002B2500D8|nr:cyclic-phosphate processing receiver domain-containing protein [Aliarcobacter butzleri]